MVLFQVLLRILFLGDSLKEAIDAPRLYHQLEPMKAKYENGTTKVKTPENVSQLDTILSKWLVQGLQSLGHSTHKFWVGGSIVQGILVDRRTGGILANADYRKEGAVDGF